MSPKRAPASPPDLPGFTYLDLLGSGGFADVYLYEQQLPKRRVAVKVLLTDRLSSGSVEEFTAEANVMAMLSTHPAIVTIYQAGVARDGRPYLVMEYCPKPNLQARYRREPFSVAESLRVGIQVAAAVETAHRAGVLHRDIKPANILVTEYNRPALTDFGIASTTNLAEESAGLSIPWSSPESFADMPRSDPRSDVYQLGATLYSLLAGHSPFELADQRNSAADLIERIERMPLPGLGRADAPASLDHALARAMSKSSLDRYESALAFARALQKVQIELSHAVTPIDILDDAAVDDDTDDDDDGLTRVRGVVSIDPATDPAAGLTRPSTREAATATPTYDDFMPAMDTVVRAGASSPRDNLDETVVRAPAAPAFDTAPKSTQPPAETSAVAPAVARSRRGVWIGVSAGVLAVVVALVVIVSLPGMLGGSAEATPAPVTSSEPQDPVSVLVAEPEDLAGSAVADGVAFTWINPDPKDGDFYLYGVVTGETSEPAYESVRDTTVTVPAAPSGEVCIELLMVRANGTQSNPVRACAP
ncbi:serine/threonine-protein kinase (plasmid) [Coraliomargarita sp. W4R53]